MVCDDPSLALDAVGSSTPTVENWQFADAGIGENTPQAGTTISEGRQSGFFGPADGIETAADQNVDVRAGSGDGSKNLTATRRRLGIAEPDFEVTLAVLAATNESGVHRDRNRRRRRFRPHRGTITQQRAGF